MSNEQTTAGKLAERLPEYMPKDPSSGNYKLLDTVAPEINQLHNDVDGVDRALTVQHADTIDQLDKLGALVGIDHNSSDGKEKYRAKVLARYQLNTSEGTPKNILNSVSVITDTDFERLRYYPLPNSDSEVSVGIPSQKVDNLPLSSSEIADIVDDLAPAGKKVYARKRGDLYYITPTEYDNNDYDSSKGYDTTATNATEDFTSSTLPSGWTLNGDATFNDTNDRVDLDTSNSNDSGNVVYDNGIGGIKRWTIEFDTYIDGTADEVTVNFYADSPGTNEDATAGYQLQIDHYNDEIAIYDFYNSAVIDSVSVTVPDSTSTNSVRLSYFKGRIRVFLNDEQLFETTISNPDYTYDGLSFGGWSGGSSGLHSLNSFRFIGGDQNDPNGSSSGTYAGLVN